MTGCSTGFERELGKQVLELGYRVVVTARRPAEIKDLAAMGETLVLKLDVTNQRQINAAIKAAEKRFGPIDVLVNNAGIGYFAAIEEGEESEVRRLFEINVFGLLLGKDAYEGATAKLKELSKEFSAWEAVARGADFPKAKS